MTWVFNKNAAQLVTFDELSSIRTWLFRYKPLRFICRHSEGSRSFFAKPCLGGAWS